jgi:predicted transcriptional regulator
MSSRLQIIVPQELEHRVRKSAQRSRISTSAWVRRAIEQALVDERPGNDALDRLASLSAPTGDIDDVLADIEAGRRA